MSGLPARYELDTKALFSVGLDDDIPDELFFDELNIGHPNRLWEIE